MDKLLTEITIKLTHELRRQLVGVADADGISASAYVRALVVADLDRRRAKHLALVSIFGNGEAYPQDKPSVTGADADE
jgi:hypothetical protein